VVGGRAWCGHAMPSPTHARAITPPPPPPPPAPFLSTRTSSAAIVWAAVGKPAEGAEGPMALATACIRYWIKFLGTITAVELAAVAASLLQAKEVCAAEPAGRGLTESSRSCARGGAKKEAQRESADASAHAQDQVFRVSKEARPNWLSTTMASRLAALQTIFLRYVGVCVLSARARLMVRASERASVRSLRLDQLASPPLLFFTWLVVAELTAPGSLLLNWPPN
jgi:hypothetical protein